MLFFLVIHAIINAIKKLERGSMKRFLGILIVWIMACLLFMFLFGALFFNIYGIALVVAFILTLFTFFVLKLSDEIETLQKRIEKIENGNTTEKID